MAQNDHTREIFRILFGSGAQESVKFIVTKALGLVVPSAVAGPIATVPAALVKQMAEAFFRSTSLIENKIDAILAEPLRTAMNTVSEVLSVNPRTPVEHNERDRRLGRAFDNLEKAYTLAARTSQPVVRVYQALVAALKSGGGQYVPIYVKDIRAIAAEARASAECALQSASEIRIITGEQLCEMDSNGLMLHGGIEHDAAMWAVSSYISDQHSTVQALQKQAEKLKTFSETLDVFCNFVMALSECQITN